MRVTLEVRSGPDTGRFIAVMPGSEITVGRKAPARFVIDGDPTLSRTHFALTHEADRCQVRDLGSTAGTLLNGEAVITALVKDGDVIEAGSTHLVVRIDAKAPAEPIAHRPRPSVLDEPDRDGPPTEEIPTTDEESVSDRILNRLRSQKDSLFAILDAARDPMVLIRLLDCKEQHQSLYEGPKGDRLAAAAPYLVAMPPRSPFLETIVRDGWGQSWGVYLTSSQPFAEVRKHLRRSLTVKTEEGKELLFRFYDPRVLRVFLPTCNADERTQFFGPIRAFLMEGADCGELLEFEPGGRRSIAPAALGRVAGG